MGKFDDTGIISPNKFRKGNDKAPTHKGVVNLSRATLRALLAKLDDGEEAKLEISGWRKTDKPDMISLKIQLPYEGSGSGGGKRRRDDDDDDRGERRSSRGRDRDDEDERDRGRGRSRQRDLDDDIPSERRDSRRRDNYRDDDYGDDRDL